MPVWTNFGKLITRIIFLVKRYKKAMLRKRRNQKEIPTPKTEVGKTKLIVRYLYLETYRKPSEKLFPNRRPLSYPNLNKKKTLKTHIRFKQHKNWVQSSVYWVTAYLEIAAHLAYAIFSKYRYLIVRLVFPISIFWIGIYFVSDCAISWSWPSFTLL